MTPVQWGSINYWILACAHAEPLDYRSKKIGIQLATLLFGVVGPSAAAAYDDAASAIAEIIDRAPHPEEPFAMWCADRDIPLGGPMENLRRALFIADLRRRAERFAR